MSASLTSSKVLLKDSISCVGNFLIKPTVSVRRNGNVLITTFLTVVSSVANNLSSAKTLLLDNIFIIVDFPTLVYPTNATLTNDPLFPLWTFICLSIVDIFLFNSEILSLTILLSVSISVSPGPLIPIPPLCLSRWVHSPFSLGSKYSY